MLIYLFGNLTAQRPICMPVRVKTKKKYTQIEYGNNTIMMIRK
jgi:hypothetical protein